MHTAACLVEPIVEMRSQGLRADVITCSAAISAFVKSTQEQRVPGLIVEVRSQGLQADVISYSAAISAVVRSPQWQRWAARRGDDR